MDFSALERDIRALENYSDSLGSWLEFWTALVVLGLIVEYVPHFIKLAKDFNDKRSFIARALIEQRSFDWVLLRETVGGILIIAGVAGELWVGARASHVETDLRIARGKLTEQLRNDAAIAMKKASEAESHLGEVKIRASNAEERAWKAEKAAEDEKIERLKLEAQVAPRSLSLDQQRLITAALRRFSGRQATLSSYGLDGEGASFGAQLISVLRTAGIIIKDLRASFISTGGFELGIHIRGPDKEREFMSGLAGALSSIGKLQVFINAPTFRAGVTQGGTTIMGGAATIAGGGGVVVPDIPSTGPVSIMIGIKLVPVLIAK